MRLSTAQRRYLLFNQLIPAVLINFLINLFFGWLFFHASPTVRLLQSISLSLLPNSIALDLVPTTFFLVFFTGLVVSRQIRRLLRNGEMEPLGAGLSLLNRYRPHDPFSSFHAALLATLLLVPLTVGLLYWYGVRDLPLWSFIWFKALYASLLAALSTPLIVVVALTETEVATGRG